MISGYHYFWKHPGSPHSPSPKEKLCQAIHPAINWDGQKLHPQQVLREKLRLSDEELSTLRQQGVIA